MFSLIVSSGLQHAHSGSIWASRVFSHTEDSVEKALKTNGKIDIGRLLTFPTILMEEGDGAEVAAVCWLSRIELVDRDYQFNFSVDADIPRFTNADLHEMAADLKIGSWQFNTNHWSVKDVDLFQVFYRHKFRSKAKPEVFKLSDNPINPRLVSVMMPFSGNCAEVYKSLEFALKASDYECSRADNFWQHAHIMQDIIELICTSRVVICDLTGKNPNVFYEAGIAHTLGKEVMLITQNIEDVPFDLRSLRCLIYLNNQEGREALCKSVLSRLRTVTG